MATGRRRELLTVGRVCTVCMSERVSEVVCMCVCVCTLATVSLASSHPPVRATITHSVTQNGGFALSARRVPIKWRNWRAGITERWRDLDA